jgi:hypothetical protein
MPREYVQVTVAALIAATIATVAYALTQVAAWVTITADGVWLVID